MSSPPPPESSTSTQTSRAHKTNIDTPISHTDNTVSPTADTSTMPPTPSLTLILAATPSLGIGKAGALPWPMLKKEMAYFARITKRVAPASQTTSEEGKQRVNAVIMGRKTWDSVPPKFRPLKGRLNVVLSRHPSQDLVEASGADGGGGSEGGSIERPLVASGVLDALAKLSSLPSHLSNLSISRIFVIGGASVYTTALELPQTNRILLTQIQREYECDTFFSLNLAETTTWRKAGRQEMEEWTGEEIKEDGEMEVVKGENGEEEVRFEFGMWERAE